MYISIKSKKEKDGVDDDNFIGELCPNASSPGELEKKRRMMYVFSHLRVSAVEKS